MFKNQFYVFLQHIFCFPSLLIRNLIVIIPRIKKLNSLLYLGDKSPIYFIIYGGESGSKKTRYLYDIRISNLCIQEFL